MKATHERKACEAAGGVWGRIGLHVGCQCPTGQGHCPCARKGDCLGACELRPDAGAWCSAGHDVVGCYEYLDESGARQQVCAD